MRRGVEKKISKVFYAKKGPESFVTTPHNVLKRIKIVYPSLKVSIKDIKSFLALQEVYQLHRNSRKRFLTNQIIIAKPDEQMCMDLIDFTAFEKYNKGLKFILVAMDQFTRYAYGVPMVNKNEKTCLKAIKDVIDNLYVSPVTINTDAGTEFLASSVQSYLKRKNIKHYIMEGHTKNGQCERLIRTLKNRIFKRFDLNLNRDWVNILDDVVTSYNKSVNSSIGIEPYKVSYDNADLIFNKYYRNKAKKKKPRLKAGMSVRLNLALGPFSKNYEQSFSRQIYRVSSNAIYPNMGIYPTYRIETLTGRSIPGKYYEDELLSVDTAKFVDKYSFPVEKILKYKKDKAYVKFLGYSSKDNAWIPIKNVKKIPIL
ncbi:MAG: DDE-type integrase/transposase/recombinase [Campylobacteraceae bacterium]|nr:DDE-type integrase/transposase/recombinase [Campylobacteraceae bacterium]